jgi:hypothetical protein
MNSTSYNYLFVPNNHDPDAISRICWNRYNRLFLCFIPAIHRFGTFVDYKRAKYE